MELVAVRLVILLPRRTKVEVSRENNEPEVIVLFIMEKLAIGKKKFVDPFAVIKVKLLNWLFKTLTFEPKNPLYSLLTGCWKLIVKRLVSSVQLIVLF